jgi:hypothetical protein
MKRIDRGEWVLGEEIYKALHRWALIVSFFLVGSLLGFLSSCLLPAPYEATLSLFVNLNPYRVQEDRSVAAFAQADFRNIDDYKHWQMSQLSVLMMSDEYLEETLSRVVADGEFWNDADLESLRSSLRLSWRNAGEWKMAAKASDPVQAVSLVTAWRQVSLEKINAALEKSRRLFRLEQEMRSLEDSIDSNLGRRAALLRAQKSLNQISNTLDAESGGQAIPPLTHEKLWMLTAGAADLTEGWRSLLNSFPSQSARTDSYRSWIDHAQLMIEADLELVEQKMTDLEGELDQVNARWEETLQASQGLSPTLAVKVVTNSDASVRRSRTPGTALLAGGTLGLLGWGILILVQISRRDYL